MEQGRRIEYQADQFPSPCGDVILKLKEVFAENMDQAEFPPPYGDVVLKLWSRAVVSSIRQISFRPLVGM